MSAPLKGIRVLDLSRVLAGPWCSQNLADLGAEVIKVERPGAGDDTRGWGPPFAKAPDGTPTRESAYFLSTNRGKRSITLDLARPEGQAIARELAAKSDILLENYKVGGLARYGLDYPTLAQSCPRLIYCSITGFGQTGPYRERAGYDFLMQGMGGLMSITGEPDEVPGGGPVKAGIAVTDIMTGQYATIAVLAALQARHASGRGQHIDLALFDVQVSYLSNQAMHYLVSGEVPPRIGNGHPSIVPYQTFRAADGSIIVATGNDGQYQRLCTVLGLPELAQDPRFLRNADRVRNRIELAALLGAAIARETMDHWIAALEAAGVPCGPINTMDRVFADPQAQARGLSFRLPHPTAGEVPVVASPLRFSDTPVEHVRPPLLSEHTEAVLTELLGRSHEQVAALRESGIV
ncbi:MAG: CaiB/BaiF CoA transferase family protein [Pseudomonadota bacterium]|jgi:crotonobetainyl-CoA:carnitine CoA-transferase CaiB-like acyl-CoA transferase